jgi:hypothetical protein
MLLAQNEIPKGWHFQAHQSLNDGDLGDVQQLNAATQVSPYPAYYSRGEDVPIVTTMSRNATNELVATGSACMRFHPQSRSSGTGKRT